MANQKTQIAGLERHQSGGLLVPYKNCLNQKSCLGKLHLYFRIGTIKAIFINFPKEPSCHFQDPKTRLL